MRRICRGLSVCFLRAYLERAFLVVLVCAQFPARNLPAGTCCRGSKTHEQSSEVNFSYMGKVTAYLRVFRGLTLLCNPRAAKDPLHTNRLYSCALTFGQGAPEMPVVCLCRVSKSKLFDIWSVRVAPEQFAAAVSYYATGKDKSLKGALPFSFQGHGSKEADAAKVNAAFEQLSKDPLWQFTALDEKPLGELKHDGMKNDQTFAHSMLEYAQLGTTEHESVKLESVQLKDKSSLSDSEAYLAFGNLKDKDE